MDKTFEEIISETLGEYTDSNEDQNVDDDVVDDSSDVEDEAENISDDSNDVEDDETTDTDVDDEDLDVDDEDNSNPSTNEKDVQAFIQLRQLNKQMKEENSRYKDYIDFLDERAKNLGLSGVDEFMEKAKESALKQNAEQQGIPVDVLKRINELEETVSEQQALREEAERQKEENRLASTFESFIQKNHLSQEAVETIAKDLTVDGINLSDLKNLSDNAINRILNSYIPKENQKQNDLAKKEKIKKELPVNNDSKSSTKGQEDQLDAIAKAFAGKY